MHKNSQNKLLNAGFTFVDAKVSDKPGRHTIWQKTPLRRSWHLMEKEIETKAALKRRMVELLKDEKTIDIYDSWHKI